MPRAKEHFIIGACVGLALDFLKQRIQMAVDPSRDFDWFEFGAVGAAGGFVGVAADLIEPATSPNHRAFFHSVTCAGVTVYAAHGPHTAGWDEKTRFVAETACWCYLSHLVADATTPNGIGLI